jgi:hypothetical protein
MSQIVLDAIAAEIALLERQVTTPQSPSEYGTDLSCVSDLTETLDEVDASSPFCIVQALCRRYQTPRGLLPDDADYGLDLVSWLHRGILARDLREIEGALEAEALKDDRVDEISVSAVYAYATKTLTASLRILPKDSIDAFSATLAATSAGVILEAIS